MEESKSMTPKVSVIIPVYHSEFYLARCCRSLFGQTLDAFECLFIIDGPSISAEAIISETLAAYPHRQSQVTILRHAENLGTSYSRQEGHEQAHGEYLYHCDSDDWMEPDALQKAYELANQESADLVFFDYVRHYEVSGQKVVYRSAHVVHGVISTMDGTLCNKLIRRQFVISQDLCFPSGINWGEDLCMSVLLQILATKIAYLPEQLYHYCMHTQSYTADVSHEKYIQLVSCPCWVEQELDKRRLKEVYPSMLLKLKFEVKEYFLIHPALRDVKHWRTVYPECHSSIWQFSTVPFYLKFVSWLAAHHLPCLAEFLLQLRDLIHRVRS